MSYILAVICPFEEYDVSLKTLLLEHSGYEMKTNPKPHQTKVIQKIWLKFMIFLIFGLKLHIGYYEACTQTGEFNCIHRKKPI